MEFNRNQFMLAGMLVLLLGFQFRTFESFTLNEKMTRFIATKVEGQTATGHHADEHRRRSAKGGSAAELARLVVDVGRLGLDSAQLRNEKTGRLARVVRMHRAAHRSSDGRQRAASPFGSVARMESAKFPSMAIVPC